MSDYPTFNEAFAPDAREYVSAMVEVSSDAIAKKMTDELRSGDRVRLPGGLIRTVAYVHDADYLGRRGDCLRAVEYREGSTREWSGGNLAAYDSEWEVVS